MEEVKIVRKNSFARTGKIVLIAGGVAILTYLVIQNFTKKKKKKKKYVEDSMDLIGSVFTDSEIMKNIRNSIATFLLSVAKQKLMDLLKWVYASSPKKST
jgi:hypothetical protein